MDVVGLVTAASQVLDLLQRLKSPRRPTGTIKLLQAEVFALHEVLQSLQPLVIDNDTQVPIIPTSLLHATTRTLVVIMDVMEKHLAGSKISRAITGILQQDQIEHLREELDRHKSSFVLILSSYARYLVLQMPVTIRNLLKAVCYGSIRIASTNDNIQALHRRIEHMQSLNADQMQKYETKLRESTEQASRDRILSWVSTYDFYAKHGDKRSSRMRGTCQWLIQSPKFSSWRRSSGGVFVLEGKAGSGKSILVSSVIDNIQLAAKSSFGEAVAYFYIDYLEGSHGTLGRLISSLLRQLLQQLRSLPYSVVKAYDDFGDHGKKFTDDEACQALLDAATSFSRVYICIDALDELKEEEQQRLLKLIEELPGTEIHVLISSRPISQLDFFLHKKLDRTDWLYQLRISESDLKSDIESFVQAKIESTRRFESQKELQVQIAREINKWAEGMFLWVDLVLRDLLRQRTPKGMQRCIESTPVGVEAMYDRLLSQMIEDAKDGKQSIGKIAISILLHSDRSVDTTVICGMLDAVLHSQDSPKEMALNTEIVVVECGGFVEAEPSRRYLRFIHQTAREFLKSKTLFQGVTLPAWPQSTVEHDHQSFEPINYDDVRSSLASDTDETASRVSWSSNPFSSASSMSSQSSIFSQLETVTDQFARMFAADENLRSIILESLDKQGLAGFEQVFSNLLRGYSKGLQLIAKAPSEQVAALMAGQQTRVIARETVVRLGYLDNVKLFPWNSKDDETPGKAAVLDHYLQDKDKRLGHHDFKVGGESSKVGQALGRSLDESLPLQRDSPLRVQGDDYWFDDTQADEEKEEIEEDNVEAYVNLQRVKQFLTFSPPFKNLIDNLRQRLQPKLIIPPIDFEDLEPEPPFKPNPRTRWQNIIAMISANMRTFWEYAIRPAIGGEVPLAPGMKRVRWTCVCGRTYYDDFVEIKPGAVAEIQTSLNVAYQRRMKDVSDQPTPAKSDLRQVILFAGLGGFTWVVSYAFTWLRSLGGSFDNGLITGMTCAYIFGVLGWSSWKLLRRRANLSQPTSPGVTTDPSRTLLHIEAKGASRPTPFEDFVFEENRQLARRIKRYPGSSQDGDESVQVDNVIGVPDSVIERPPDNIITSTITAAGQPQGSNFSEVGDMGLQRLSARNQDADYKEEQDPGDTKVRTFDWADAEQEGQSSVQPLWIIPCFQNPEGDDQAVQVRVSSKTLDGVLFSRFRHEYFTIPNWWSRFAKMHQVTAIKFVMFGLTVGNKPEQYIADIRKTDVWPPKTTPQIWLYKPCPAETIPLVGQRYLMKIWRESHHADWRTYEEWKQHASWYERAKDWIRHAFPRWWERRLDHWALDKKAKSIEVERGILPRNLNRADLQQPTPTKRNRYAIVAIPKKIGDRIEPDLGRDNKEEVWGLLFEEGFAVHRLLFYVLILYFLASLIAVVLLCLQKSPLTGTTTSATPQPLANKTWIFIWVGTFVTLFLGVWFKWAETPKGAG